MRIACGKGNYTTHTHTHVTQTQIEQRAKFKKPKKKNCTINTLEAIFIYFFFNYRKILVNRNWCCRSVFCVRCPMRTVRFVRRRVCGGAGQSRRISLTHARISGCCFCCCCCVVVIVVVDLTLLWFVVIIVVLVVCYKLQ